MSKEQWNSRYSEVEYVYGVEPNNFLRNFLEGKSPGRILLAAEGEGRNAVYAASLGWEVDAFDQSEKGKEKALHLASQKEVQINYTLTSLEEWNAESFYDCIALIFVHMIPALRKEVHQKMTDALKPDGYLILEAFTKKQMPRTSGGPKNLDLLYDADEVLDDFRHLTIIEFSETQVILDEGQLHRGLADIVRLIVKKP